MTLITCSKCKVEKESYINNPFIGSALGEKIKEQTCESCFNEWQTQQTMEINENQLNTSIKEHGEILVKKLKEFLNII